MRLCAQDNFQENLRFFKDEFIRNAGFWLGNQVFMFAVKARKPRCMSPLATRWYCCLLTGKAFLPECNNAALCAAFLAVSASNPVEVVSEKPRAPSVVRQACQLTLKVNGERKHSLHLGFLAPCTCIQNPWSVWSTGYREGRGGGHNVPSHFPLG